MTTWIALLRGINVSGQRPVPMQRLRDILEAVGLRNVRTYVQSGNVVFAAAESAEELIRRIETGIKKEFGFAVPVILRSAGEWKKLVKANLFASEPGIDPAKLHVTFLAAASISAAAEKLTTLPVSADRFHRKGREIYLHCPDGYGRTKLTNALFERKLGVGATTRNWKTVTTLGEMAVE